MYQLFYSPYGIDGWKRFRTTDWYWKSSQGYPMTYNFETLMLAAKTVREWFDSPGTHYPVGIFPDGTAPAALILHDPDSWPFKAWRAGDRERLVSVKKSEAHVVVVV